MMNLYPWALSGPCSSLPYDSTRMFSKEFDVQNERLYGTATTSFGACGERGVVHINSERALCILHVSKSVFRLDLVAFR